MSPRFLVKKYPCRDCHAPVPVPNRRQIPFATCERCLARRCHLGRGAYADESASRQLLEVNGKAEVVPLLIGCLKAAQDAARAAEIWLGALDVARPEELRRLAKAARSRTDWAADLLQQLDPFLAEVVDDLRERSPVRKVLAGGGEAPAAAPPAALRLVPRDLEPAPERPEPDELPPGWRR